MWRAVAIIAATCVVTACGSTHSNTGRKASATIAGAGCGRTPVLRGAVPAWTAPAFADSSPGPPIWVHAISAHATVVAIVFGYPLRAGKPTDRTNKILWIMRLPRHGSPLRIDARPLSAAAPRIRVTEPADSCPGEIYPSQVNVPTAGCWRMTLHWAGHTDSIDLRYKA